MMDWAHFCPVSKINRQYEQWVAEPYEITFTPKGHYQPETANADTYTANRICETGRVHVGIYGGLAQAQDACTQDFIKSSTNRLLGKAL